jgi:hypothetical protein
MKHIYYFEDPELRDIDEDYYSRKWLDGDDDDTPDAGVGAHGAVWGKTKATYAAVISYIIVFII